jgi:NhaP-type Na+/H+ or K+/H+ antiporter
LAPGVARCNPHPAGTTGCPIDAYILATIGFGALILLVAWLPLVLDRLPLSLPIVCVLIGAVVFSIPGVGIRIVPGEAPEATQRLSEVVVLVALMGAGLKLDRPFGLARWQLVWRLLGIAMPLSILAIALVLVVGLGLPVASALLLAAALAPTDPVLASDVQVGPPRTGQEDDVRFSLTAEAGLNDGLAFPFVALAIAVSAILADRHPVGTELVDWVLYDVLWRIAAGVAVGWLVGRFLGWLTFRLPRRTRLSTTGDGFVALGITFIAYGVTEAAHGYGFLAVFVAALTLRAVERNHHYHERLHDFIEQSERLLIMVVLLLFGGALASGLLAPLGWADIGAAVVIILVVRPLTAGLSLVGSGRPRLERALIAFLGIRGVGTIYYLAYALDGSSFEGAERLWAIAGLIILLSVFIHGVTATPLMAALDRRAHKSGRRGGTI